VIPLANGLFSVLRGASANAWGDDTDASTVVATGVPMALQASARGRSARSEGQLRQVETFTGWAPYATDLLLDDRIKDEATSAVYVIASLSRPRGVVVQNGWRLEARRVSS
jgi:hypothetical protein